MQPKTFASQILGAVDVLDELLYADDMRKNASTERKMQEAMDRVLLGCDYYDLKISEKKK